MKKEHELTKEDWQHYPDRLAWWTEFERDGEIMRAEIGAELLVKHSNDLMKAWKEALEKATPCHDLRQH